MRNVAFGSPRHLWPFATPLDVMQPLDPSLDADSTASPASIRAKEQQDHRAVGLGETWTKNQLLDLLTRAHREEKHYSVPGRTAPPTVVPAKKGLKFSGTHEPDTRNRILHLLTYNKGCGSSTSKKIAVGGAVKGIQPALWRLLQVITKKLYFGTQIWFLNFFFWKVNEANHHIVSHTKITIIIILDC